MPFLEEEIVLWTIMVERYGVEQMSQEHEIKECYN